MSTHRTWAVRAAAAVVAFLLTGALTLLFNGPSHTDTAAPGAWGESGCDAQKQARIIVVRGTEEPAGQSLMSPLASRIAAELGDHAQVSDLDYPASWESGSEAAGVNRLIAVLNAQSAQCPAMRTVLLGYSQGAMVVGDALSAPDTRFNEDNGYELSPVARGHIVAVELYGDPRFSAAASYNSGDFDRAVDGILGALGARGAEDFGEIADRTVSFCTARDFACQAGGDTEPHGSYATNGMLDEGMKYAVDRVKATL
ncbi:cutinase family protein [uncultured Bifidobacterium sp.]|uniref:cutinase family protein n=1 Tax=uncultured Bifidobacterium sp. TaxID=165187 RepID=UPI00258B5DA8|nr:cutinase family protein [uncultured Bifidobacterium sp.]